MIRKLLYIAASTALAFVMAAGSASAGVYDPGNSFLRFKIGAITSIDIPATGGSVTLTDDGSGGHIVTESGTPFKTVARTVPSAAFTGFPNLTALKLTFTEQAGLFADGFSTPNSVGAGVLNGIGGTSTNTGQAVLLAGGFTVLIPLTKVGAGPGSTTVAPVLNNTLRLEVEAMATGGDQGTQNGIQITGISTNLLFVPTRGNILGVAFTLNLTTVELIQAIEVTAGGVVVEVNTVTINDGGNTLLSASQAGSITLVTPIRLDTGNLSGKSPVKAEKHFAFVPEPGTMLLLVSGALGLVVIGRKKMRK